MVEKATWCSPIMDIFYPRSDKRITEFNHEENPLIAIQIMNHVILNQPQGRFVLPELFHPGVWDRLTPGNKTRVGIEFVKLLSNGPVKTKSGFLSKVPRLRGHAQNIYEIK